MWRINNDADVFSWQLTSWLVDNCSERSVVFPLQCWQELCVRGKGRRGRKTKLSNLWSVKCCTVHECTKISSSSFLFEVIDNNVVRERLIAVLIQSWLVMIKVSTFQLMVTGGYVIWKQLYWEHVENGFHSEWPEHAGGPHPPTVGGGLAKSTSSGAGVIPARHRQGYQQLFHQQLLSAKFLTTDIHHPSIIRSKTAFEKRSLANVLYQLFRFFLYSRLLRGLILIHNKPVEIWPSPFYPAWKFFTIVQALRGNRIILQMMVSLQFQQV